MSPLMVNTFCPTNQQKITSQLEYGLIEQNNYLSKPLIFVDFAVLANGMVVIVNKGQEIVVMVRKDDVVKFQVCFVFQSQIVCL